MGEEKYRKLFNNIDTSNNKKLEIQELEKISRKIDPDNKIPEMLGMFRRLCDSDEDNGIDFPTFAKECVSVMQEAICLRLDDDSNATFSEMEFIEAAMNKFNVSNKRKAKRLFKTSRGVDYTLTYDEAVFVFLEYLCTKKDEVEYQE